MSSMSQDDNAPLLSLEGLTLKYGALAAVNDVTLEIANGTRHALIGPNGAGKSTLFSVVAGAQRPTSGRIAFNGRDITHLNEAGRARVGLVRTFQHSSLFLGLSVLDNVKLAAERERGRAMRPWPHPKADRLVEDQAMHHLRAIGLGDRPNAQCGALSHGERRQLEVAIALACEPQLLLFDEPTAGMSASETQRFSELIETLPPSVSVVIVEHDLDVVFRLASRVSVLAAGQLIADGSPDEVRADEAVREAYLGKPRTGEPLFGVVS